MRIAFTKMHGLGNDFVVLDGRETALPEIDSAAARAIADRHAGIGCDQLIVLGPADDADFAMRIFNSDGGEVEACGNASRAVGLLHGQPARIATAGGLIAVTPGQETIAVDMGEPRFDWEAIPLAYAIDTATMPIAWEELANPVAVNIGNPHVVFFVEDVAAIELERLGPLIERDPLFPDGVNVNVASAAGPRALRLRVWERGAGLTLACGTGACATAVAAIRRGLVTSPVAVELPGGVLEIAWEQGGAIVMSGPATESFRGSFEAADYGLLP